MPKATASIEKRIELGMVERLKLDKLPRWVHGIGMGGTVLVLLLFIVVFSLYKDVPVWADWVPASEFTNPQYAERIYPNSIFRTRMNTWSNLVYVCFWVLCHWIGHLRLEAEAPLGSGLPYICSCADFPFWGSRHLPWVGKRVLSCLADALWTAMRRRRDVRYDDLHRRPCDWKLATKDTGTPNLPYISELASSCGTCDLWVSLFFVLQMGIFLFGNFILSHWNSFDFCGCQPYSAWKIPASRLVCGRNSGHHIGFKDS